MRVFVRLGEPFWRLAGQRELEVMLDAPAVVGDLLAELVRRYPALQAEFAQSQPHIFLGEDAVESDAPLTEGCRVHIVWPVAGG